MLNHGMNQSQFNQFRREKLWPSLLDSLLESGDEYTILDYLSDATDQSVSVDSLDQEWLRSHAKHLHIFTRYYPYSEQPVTVLLNNPRLDYADDNSLSRSDNVFPTLEHRRYAVTDGKNIESLAKISAEHYNSYFYNNKGIEILLKRLGEITETLKLSEIVDSLPDKHRWNRDLDSEGSTIRDSVASWREYFYNPETTKQTLIDSIEDTFPPHPSEVLNETTGVFAGDRGLSAVRPNLTENLYGDFYFTNLYKFGTSNKNQVPIRKGKNDTQLHTQLSKQEIKKAGSELIIAMGLSSQKVFDSAKPVFTHEKTDFNNTTRRNYGTAWRLDSGQYVLAVPHPAMFNSNLSQAFSGINQGWNLISKALLALESELNI